MRDCFICKDSKVEYCFTVDNQEHVKCTNCGLIYVDKIKGWDELYQAYDGGFWKSLRRKIFSPVRSFKHSTNYQGSLERARFIAKFIKDHTKEGSEKIKFLDVGCNRGFLLAAVAEFSWDVYGNEVVPEHIAPFKKTYKQFAANIVCEKLDNTLDVFHKESFGVISGIDVIEHFEDPLNDMKIIHSLLKPGGIFIIQTPDADCEKAKTLGKKWGALKPLEHLHLFNSTNLKMLSDTIGYSSIEFFPQFEEADGNFVAVMKKKGLSLN